MVDKQKPEKVDQESPAADMDVGPDPQLDTDQQRTTDRANNSFNSGTDDDETLVGPPVDTLLFQELSSRYDIGKELGKGGMGVVHLATHRNLNRLVAIKRILDADEESLKRFVTEAHSLAKLNHVNIVQVYDFAYDFEGPFLVLEYVSGGSLLDRLKDGKLSVKDSIHIMCQLCDALTLAHDKGIIHRDIKPANILLTEDGIPKLTDFGLARVWGPSKGQTDKGQGMGTPDYMSPEQWEDATSVDERSDLFSLAATFYRMITGRSYRMITGKKSLAIPDGILQNLRAPLLKALAFQPEDRFNNVSDFKTELQGITFSDGPNRVCPRCKFAYPSNHESCSDCGELTTTVSFSGPSPIVYEPDSTTFTPVHSESLVTLNETQHGRTPYGQAILGSELRIRQRLNGCDGYSSSLYQKFQKERCHLGFETVDWSHILQLVRDSHAFEIQPQELLGCPDEYGGALRALSEVLQKRIEALNKSIYMSKSGNRLDEVILERTRLSKRHKEAKQDWLTARSAYLDEAT
jgi:serine/threonine protein kinase